MDTISLDFEQAKAKHLLFKSNLRSILYGLDVDVAPVVSHTECAVGKWIYDHALKTYGQYQEMHELEQVHADLHRTAKTLVETYNAGQVEEARKGLVGIETIADALVSLLTTLEQKIKSQPAPASTYQDITVSIDELSKLSKANLELDKVIKSETAGLVKEKWLLQEAFMQIPASISILKGPEHIVQFANPVVKAALGDREFVGKSVRELFPELGDQGYISILDGVYTTGEPFVGNEMRAVVELDGKEQEFYSNVSYSAIRTEAGEIEGILAFSYDVSEQVRARNAAEEAAERLKQAYEDLEVKVKFRNIELERTNRDLQKKLDGLEANAEPAGDGA
ncbi:MAG: sensor signal transduction histidine kinase [Flaviaesturariibacter sp.]|nr:sensor signal transduction histidine kinase [Flaviaesturariibacter sp.]